jgi:hypothetical protein
MGTIREVSVMDAGEERVQQPQTHAEAKELRDNAWELAMKAYKEAKAQADIVYDAAKKAAVDKEARIRVDAAYDEAIAEAKKVRDAITRVADAVFAEFWRK